MTSKNTIKYNEGNLNVKYIKTLLVYNNYNKKFCELTKHPTEV